MGINCAIKNRVKCTDALEPQAGDHRAALSRTQPRAPHKTGLALRQLTGKLGGVIQNGTFTKIPKKSTNNPGDRRLNARCPWNGARERETHTSAPLRTAQRTKLPEPSSRSEPTTISAELAAWRTLKTATSDVYGGALEQRYRRGQITMGAVGKSQ